LNKKTIVLVHVLTVMLTNTTFDFTKSISKCWN